MTHQGLIWNCRGLRENGVATFLKSVIFQYNLNFIVLQETTVEECEDSLLRNFDSNQDYLWLWNPSRGKSGAILIGVGKKFYDVGSLKQGDFMLQVNLWDKQNRTKWNLLVVYGATQEENKGKIFD
jgi:hypothetical protein